MAILSANREYNAPQRCRSPQVHAGGSHPRWRPDGKELFFLAPDNRLMAAEIREKGAGLEVGRVERLFQVQPPRAMWGYPYDVSSDGKQFLVVTETEQAGNEPITLVVNWTAALRR